MQATLLSDFFTKAELAEAIDRSERTLDRWHNMRMGPPRTRLGSRILYRKDAVRAWLVAQEEQVALRGRDAA